MGSAAFRSRAVVLLFLIHCLLLQPLVVKIVFGICFVMQYIESVLVQQSISWMASVEFILKHIGVSSKLANHPHFTSIVTL